LDEAASREAQGDLTGAIAVLRNADVGTAQNAEFIEMQNRIETKYKQKVIANAVQAYESSGYLEAVQIVQEGIGILQGNHELALLRQDYLDRAPVDLLTFDYLDRRGAAEVVRNEKDNIGNT